MNSEHAIELAAFKLAVESGYAGTFNDWMAIEPA